MKKVLVIRFSSFGDVVQASTVNHQLKDAYPKVTIIWLTKRSFAQFLEKDPNVDQVVHLEDFGGLLSLARWLKLESFNLIYDAHRSMRSSMLFLISKLLRNHSTWVRRSKDRWKRFFLFKFRINLFPKPFVGQASYISPLTPYGLSLIPNKSNWNFSENEIEKVNKFVDCDDYIVFAPSAAWEMKRWPIDSWKKLVTRFSKKYPNIRIVITGGPNDHFTSELEINKSVINLSGKLSLSESSYLVTRSMVTVSADTGIIHVVDAHQLPGILLNGPTAFGKTFSPSIKILEAGLYCQPCSKDGRGKCHRETYQLCMVEISVDHVMRELEDILSF